MRFEPHRELVKQKGLLFVSKQLLGPAALESLGVTSRTGRVATTPNICPAVSSPGGKGVIKDAMAMR